MNLSLLNIPNSKKRRLENGDVSDVLKLTNNDSEAKISKFRVGSRKSQLALFQTNFVVGLLRNQYSGILYDIVSMTTTGDKILDVALSKIGEKSLFTKELEVALENKDVHMVVHSLKDLPTSLPSGMVIGAICKRENPHDVVVFPKGVQCKDLKELSEGSVIGTSSLRRIAQLSRLYPHVRFESVRGNLNTRLRKLDEDKKYAALILAAAGLIRLDLENRIGKILNPDECMYAVGQGALAIECREDDSTTLALLSKISDEKTTLCCIAERAFMKALQGGCSVPIAVNSSIEDNTLTLQGGVFNLDGSKCLTEKLSSNVYKSENQYKPKINYAGIVAPHISQTVLAAAENLGQELASLFITKGAEEILQETRKDTQMNTNTQII